jgi:hypothetical protein
MPADTFMPSTDSFDGRRGRRMTTRTATPTTMTKTATTKKTTAVPFAADVRPCR